MAVLPATMKSLVAPRKGTPATYDVVELPTPKIESPTEVIIRVHAGSLQPGEVQIASGQLALFHTPSFPLKLGMEGSGVVVAVGAGVKGFQVGDAVYGYVADKPVFGPRPAGFLSEYAVADEKHLLLKPSRLPFTDLASVSGSVCTAYQAIRQGLQLTGATSLEGQTVFIPAGLGNMGSTGAQVAKNVFGAEKIITTVSTPKVALVEKLLPGVFDEVIDYQKTDLRKEARHSVTFAYNTHFNTFDDCVAMLSPKEENSVLMSVAGMPSASTAKAIMGPEKFSWWIAVVLYLAQLKYWWALLGTDIKYAMRSGDVQIREDFEKAGEMIALGKVKSVSTVVDFDDLDGIRVNGMAAMTNKGGIGKLVVKMLD